MDSAITAFVNSPASTLGLLVIVMFLLARGYMLPINWVNKLLESKDEIIEKLTAQVEADAELKPTLLKLLKALEAQAEKKVESDDRT